MNEVNGIGNHNTALFWEYDTRLGRRWNLDPKPNASLSSYVAFANNPILNTDVLGDTVRLMGTDAFKKRTLAHMQKLTHDELAISVEGYVTVKTRVTQNCERRLNKGTLLIREVTGNSNQNIIQHTSGDNKTDNTTVKNREGEVIRQYGDMKYNPDLTIAGKDSEGNKHRPAHIGLAHELIHMKRGNKKQEVSGESNITDPDDTIKKLDNEEVETRKEENAIRDEHALPARITIPARTSTPASTSTP